MKLKSYLDLDPEKRADWGFFVDARLAARDTKASNVKDSSRTNHVLQTWSPNQRDIPASVRSMLRVSKKYNLTFDTVNPSAELRGQLPLFHHFGEDESKTQWNNSSACVCLRVNHGVISIDDGLLEMGRLDDPDHVPQADCSCIACSEDREGRGCANPHACATAVVKRANLLHPKWNPLTGEHPLSPLDGLALATDEAVFVPPPQISSLSDGFRIFVDAAPPPSLPAPARSRRRNRDEVPAPLPPASAHLYVSGATVRSRAGALQAGAAAVFPNSDSDSQCFRISGHHDQTTPCAEAFAALVGVRKVPVNTPLTI
ncbi:hypothetical protein FB45DRAFT_1091203, partial [Roridomyces roridus]